MRNMVASKAFKLAFIISTLVFALINLRPSSSNCPVDSKTISFHCYETYGFPFTWHENGTLFYLGGFVWSGVVANLTIAMVTGIALGLSFKVTLDFIYKKLGFPR